MAKLQLIPGDGTKIKAQYRLGKAEIPVVAVTRISKDAKGLSDFRLMALFGKKLPAAFLDAMDKAEMSPKQVLEQAEALRPVKETNGKPRIQSEVKTLVRLLAAKTSQLSFGERYDELKAKMDRPELKEAVVEALEALKGKYGVRANGSVPLRIAGPNVGKGLAKYRAEHRPGVKATKKK